MDDLTRTVAKNAQDLNNGQRRSFNVRLNGEEHSGTSRNGIARIYFPIDGQMMNVSEAIFKIIINDGINEGGSPGTPWNPNEIGNNLYPTLDSWKARWPLGSEIDVDGRFGCQCVDYINAFYYAQVGHAVAIGASLNAYTMWTEKKAENLGTEFVAVENWDDLQPGDWAIWEGPTTGHVGMMVNRDATGTYFWSQNYRNASEQGSPLSEDIIPQTSTFLQFLGAFRYKNWNT